MAKAMTPRVRRMMGPASWLSIEALELRARWLGAGTVRVAAARGALLELAVNGAVPAVLVLLEHTVRIGDLSCACKHLILSILGLGREVLGEGGDLRHELLDDRLDVRGQDHTLADDGPDVLDDVAVGLDGRRDVLAEVVDLVAQRLDGSLRTEERVELLVHLVDDAGDHVLGLVEGERLAHVEGVGEAHHLAPDRGEAGALLLLALHHGVGHLIEDRLGPRDVSGGHCQVRGACNRCRCRGRRFRCHSACPFNARVNKRSGSLYMARNLANATLPRKAYITGCVKSTK